MVEHARALVIGGGVVGVSALYHLALLGWRESLLVEQGELASGSAWRADCPTFSTNGAALKLQKYSVDLYRRLAADSACPVSHHVVGSVRLAHNRERMDEFAHVRAMARANGVDYEILTPGEMRERHPFAETHDLLGALWDPLDGDIDCAGLAQALAKAARDLGATIRRFAKVVDLAQEADGRWRARTDKGDEIVAGTIVNAAGYRAGEVMALIGRKLPVVAMRRQYLVTEDASELASARLPLLRDPDAAYSLRQEGAGFLLGPYERQATPIWEETPSDSAIKPGADDLARLGPFVEDATRRVPLLGRLGVKRVVNGPVPYSPDGNPYIGPEPGLRGFFHANAFALGITQAGGAGRALAEWVVNGEPSFDLWAFDRRRYGAYADSAYARAKAVEVYQNECAPAFPFEERPAGRPMKRSGLYAVLKAKGARFGARGGWERAAFFDPEGVAAAPTLSFRRPRNIDALVAGEVRGAREGVGLIDLSGLSRFLVEGAGAPAYLDRLFCTRLPPRGRAALAFALTPKGGTLSEFTLARLDAERFLLFGGAAALDHDFDVLDAPRPRDGSVRLSKEGDGFGTLALIGPRARDALSRVAADDVSEAALPLMSWRHIEVAEVELMATCVSFAGELAFELHAPHEDLPALYKALGEAGAPFGLADVGLYAIDALRLENGFPAWKSELDIGHSPLSAGLDRIVALDKGDFVGRDALIEEKRRWPEWRLVTLTLDEPGDADPPPLAPVLAEGGQVGVVTSGGWSPTFETSVALAYLRPSVARPGQTVEIEIFGARRAATVRRSPLYDPGAPGSRDSR